MSDETTEATVTRRVKIKGYTYVQEVTSKRGKTRLKNFLAPRGAEIEVTEEEAAIGDAEGFFYPVDEDTGEVTTPPGVIEVVELSDDELDDWMQGEDPYEAPATVQDVIDAAIDADSANRLLESEARCAKAEDRDVRVGVEKGLAALVGADA